MRHWILFFTFLSILQTFNLYAEETTKEEAPSADSATTSVPVTPVPVIGTLGIGTEGYGSPIRSDRLVSGEIIGSRTGYVHPFLSVGGFYTDNLFQTNNNEKSDYVAVITPGIWFALPASHQRLIEVDTMNTAPGGLALSRFVTESDRRFQGYALYRADIRRHDKYTSENRTDHRAEGSFTVNLRGGLSIEMADVYEIDYDPYGTGGTPSRELDKFKSNLFSTILSYEVTPKTSLRFDYGNYYLNYHKDRNKYRDRTDNTAAGYIFYKITPRTSVFLEAEYININYKEDINSDSDEYNGYIGIQMKASKKLTGRVKLGYGKRDYDESNIDNKGNWLAEARLDYFFTPKTSMYLRGARRVLVSDDIESNNILSYRTQVGYRQRFTSKLRGEMAIYYENNDYKDNTAIGTITASRKDRNYGFISAIGISPARWLNLSIGYEYEKRNSTINENDYTSNMVFLRATAAL